MAVPATNVTTISRAAAISQLREALSRIAGPDVSICKVAAERGIFCRGFRRTDEAGLRAQYGWIDARRPGLSRDELEALCDCWQLARQEVHQLPTACDVQVEEHDTCGGWDDFSSEDLSRFILEVLEKRVTVLPA